MKKKGFGNEKKKDLVLFLRKLLSVKQLFTSVESFPATQWSNAGTKASPHHPVTPHRIMVLGRHVEWGIILPAAGPDFRYRQPRHVPRAAA